MADPIRTKVVSPTGVLFDDKVFAIKGPGWKGGFGILPGHAPYLVRLRQGPLVLNNASDGEMFSMNIEGGFLMIANNRCTVLVEGETPEES